MARRGSPELDRLVRDLRELPRSVRRELKPALRRVADATANDMRRRSAWSSRIPGAVSVQHQPGAAAGEGFRIAVDASKAPHARPWEGNGRNGLRHRVFGRDVWVTEPARKFFFVSVDAGQQRLNAEVATAVQSAARRSGFR
jgi:hypothetical protein